MLRGCLILIRFDVVIVISILASLFLEHSVDVKVYVACSYVCTVESVAVCRSWISDGIVGWIDIQSLLVHRRSTSCK